MSAKRDKNGKKVTDRKVPSNKKQAKSNKPVVFSNKFPVWKYDYFLRYDQIWCSEIKKFDKAKPLFVKAINRLSEFEKRTWLEIEQDNSCSNIEVSKLDNRAQKFIKKTPAFKDIDVLYHIRVDSTFRIWGKREQEVLHILWFDPDHKVYPTPMRHT